MRKEFKPKTGQIDYTRARWAPVINCVVACRGNILIVQRSENVNFYPRYWNGISGFLDDHRGLAQKVKDELKEELGISTSQIKSIRLGDIFDQEAPQYKKIWIVHPVLVEITTDKIKLDWEARNYKWIKSAEAKRFKLLPGFDMVLKKVSKLTRKEI